MTTRTSSTYDHQRMNGTAPIEGAPQELIDVLQKIVHNTGALLAVNNCSVALLDQAGTTLVTLAALHKQGYKSRHTRFHDSEGVAGWVAQHRQPLILNDVSLDPRFKRLGRLPVGSMVCVPLMINKDIFIGTLTASSPEKNAFDARKLHMLTIFADQAVLAISNVQLFHRVRTDQEQWHAIWSASSDGIALVDRNARFLEANPAFALIFAIDQQHIAGMHFLELLGCDDDTAPELRMIQHALQAHHPLPYIELDLPIKGASHSIGLSITPVSLTDQPFSLVIARDMTAIRDVTRMKANFLSMITHELRSPINAINGYLDLVMSGIAGHLNPQQREFIQRARSGSEHLYALVEDLLLVSRADSGQLRLNRSILTLQDLVTNSVEEMELTAADSHISIHVAIPGDFPQVYADGVRLQQVLRNLVSNAIRFTPTGGSVTITARIVEVTPASAAEEAAQKVVAVEVRDNGSGIAPEHQERIFERFYQIAQGNAGRTGGQGLGLAIVKMIVEMHGGQVTVESVPGQGSTFTFTLPGLLS